MLHDNGVLMYSTKMKASDERFIRTLKSKIYKQMATGKS